MAGVSTLGALGLGLSVDAFAAALGKGATGDRIRLPQAVRIGAVFGFFEALTPAIGWAVGLVLSSWIAAVDHWIAFALLAAVGGHMVWEGFTASDLAEDGAAVRGNQSVARLALTALATSIDACAVGVSLAILNVNIVTACLIIGAVTTVVATLGVLLGRHVGAILGRYAELLGGAALILIAAGILFQHLSGRA